MLPPFVFDDNAHTLIGTPTVVIDQFIPADQQTIIQDLGHGFFEIGATDATDLYAQSTSHLVMDLPGTGGTGITGSGENLFTAHGITVQGGAGASLLQGTSGPVQLDYAAIHFPGEGLILNDAYYGATGNDIIFANSSGDNVFGEGGNNHSSNPDGDHYGDTIHLIADPTNETSQTVWIGAYDVGHTGYTLVDGSPDYCQGFLPGEILEQAITDTNALGQHLFVNGYGVSETAITGFDLGANGDALNFLISDWAVNAVAPVANSLLGLTDWGGTTQETQHDVVFQTVASSGDAVNAATDVLLDDIGSGYLSAAALQAGLNGSQGHVALAGVANGTTVDMLIAYKTGDGGINIADVTIQNDTGGAIMDTEGVNTVVNPDVLQVHDLVHLTGIPVGVGVGNFTTDNIHLLA